MKPEKYLVRIVRPVFETAYVEVEGVNEGDAIGRASLLADDLPREEWKGRFNAEDYWYDFDCVHSGETSEGYPFSLLDFPLYGIVSSKEEPTVNSAVVQPWMDCLSPYEVAFLLTQWINQMSEERTGYYELAINNMEETLRKLKGTDEKVVSLTPPEERRFNIQLVESLLECLKLLNEVD